MEGDHQESEQIAIGARVCTTDSSPRVGTVIEDFGDLAGEEVIVDGDLTVRSRRWAVALDDGTLEFLDDDGVKLAD